MRLLVVLIQAFCVLVAAASLAVVTYFALYVITVPTVVHTFPLVFQYPHPDGIAALRASAVLPEAPFPDQERRLSAGAALIPGALPQWYTHSGARGEADGHGGQALGAAPTPELMQARGEDASGRSRTLSLEPAEGVTAEQRSAEADEDGAAPARAGPDIVAGGRGGLLQRAPTDDTVGGAGDDAIHDGGVASGGGLRPASLGAEEAAAEEKGPTPALSQQQPLADEEAGGGAKGASSVEARTGTGVVAPPADDVGRPAGGLAERGAPSPGSEAALADMDAGDQAGGSDGGAADEDAGADDGAAIGSVAEKAADGSAAVRVAAFAKGRGSTQHPSAAGTNAGEPAGAAGLDGTDDADAPGAEWWSPGRAGAVAVWLLQATSAALQRSFGAALGAATWLASTLAWAGRAAAAPAVWAARSAWWLASRPLAFAWGMLPALPAGAAPSWLGGRAPALGPAVPSPMPAHVVSAFEASALTSAIAPPGSPVAVSRVRSTRIEPWQATPAMGASAPSDLPSLLVPRQPYDVILTLDAPSSVERGPHGAPAGSIFMAQLELLGPRAELLARCSAPFSLPERHWALLAIDEAVASFVPLGSWVRPRRRVVTRRCIDGFVDPPSAPLTSVRASVSSRRAGVESGTVRVEAQLEGLAYAMHHWFVASAVVGLAYLTGAYGCCLGTCCVGLNAAVLVMAGGDDLGAEVGALLGVTDGVVGRGRARVGGAGGGGGGGGLRVGADRRPAGADDRFRDGLPARYGAGGAGGMGGADRGARGGMGERAAGDGPSRSRQERRGRADSGEDGGAADGSAYEGRRGAAGGGGDSFFE